MPDYLYANCDGDGDGRHFECVLDHKEPAVGKQAPSQVDWNARPVEPGALDVFLQKPLNTPVGSAVVEDGEVTFKLSKAFLPLTGVPLTKTVPSNNDRCGLHAEMQLRNKDWLILTTDYAGSECLELEIERLRNELRGRS